eukprot:CAMPEP_0194497384 /NCGR_PEP_ID=MMETSP0253-20130528/14337_1 /TAXON_ID=2966 /ORGANISM="Noctiluca scintillans" /LENGTH=159 /DNA_ID=CAMNT_0039338879 /DNA_START=8 /DNA_END=484 /DNA_ORIENTATION=+
MPQRPPNVLVTGTPGVGKTTFSQTLCEGSSLRHIELSKKIREDRLYREWDDEMDCSIFDEDLVCDALEPLLEEGHCVVDFHSCGFLSADLFDIVVVLRAETGILSARLDARHYKEEKVRENVEAEIFQVCLDETTEAFEDSDVKIVAMQSNTLEELNEC